MSKLLDILDWFGRHLMIALFFAPLILFLYYAITGDWQSLGRLLDLYFNHSPFS